MDPDFRELAVEWTVSDQVAAEQVRIDLPIPVGINLVLMERAPRGPIDILVIDEDHDTIAHVGAFQERTNNPR
jgi:hypothetical protein